MKLQSMKLQSMKRQFLQFLALISVATACAVSSQAATSTAEAAKNEAAHRYSEDQKLCADEPNSSRRMQCLRDAKDEYNKALQAADAKAAAEAKAGSAAPICNDCGKVTAIRVVEKEGDSGALGIIAGGVVGGLLGHQVGGGRGKDVATVAGAVGGAYAGKKVEGKVKATKVWAVSVRFDNGSERTFNFETDPGLMAGDAVKASGSTIVRR